MKKYLAILLAVVMVLGSVACATAPAAPEAPAVTDAPAAQEPTTTEPETEVKTDLKLASHNAIIEGNPYRVRYEADIQEAAAAAADHGLNVSYASFVSN